MAFLEEQTAGKEAVLQHGALHVAYIKQTRQTDKQIGCTHRKVGGGSWIVQDEWDKKQRGKKQDHNVPPTPRKMKNKQKH